MTFEVVVSHLDPIFFFRHSASGDCLLGTSAEKGDMLVPRAYKNLVPEVI